MNLEEELSQLLTSLGVTMETADQPASAPSTDDAAAHDVRGGSSSARAAMPQASVPNDAAYEGDTVDGEAYAEAELSLFQTSREHYGVFYRLDLVAGTPQLRIFSPEEQGAIKMRCYLVRPTTGSPVRQWFGVTREFDGSPAFDDARDTTEQHLLFAAGETLKRLFWAGEPELMEFPREIEVARLV